jgi:broad specificity phosphatase PhoE
MMPPAFRNNCDWSESPLRYVVVIFLTLAVYTVAPVRGQSAKTIILVRHAEKASESPRDPSLTSVGTDRAVALADALIEMNIDHVITSQYLRTIETAAVVAERSGLTPEVIPAGASEEALHEVVSAVERRASGESILIVGHSNTIPRLVGALGGSKLPDLVEDEYDSIFIVILSPDHDPRTMRFRFGVPHG